MRLNAYLSGRDASQHARGWVVHRLDRETSGLVLFAKSELIKAQLQEAWSAVEKTYWALVEGRPATDEGTISNYLSENRKSLKVFGSDRQTPGARKAITHYRLLKSHGGLSLLEVRLETGRKHQIRAHLAYAGCPVVGDARYGAASNTCGRMALSCLSTGFCSSRDSRTLKFSIADARGFGQIVFVTENSSYRHFDQFQLPDVYVCATLEKLLLLA